MIELILFIIGDAAILGGVIYLAAHKIGNAIDRQGVKMSSEEKIIERQVYIPKTPDYVDIRESLSKKDVKDFTRLTLKNKKPVKIHVKTKPKTFNDKSNQ